MNLLLCIAALCATAGEPDAATKSPAAIRLYNPTPCTDAGLVEIPVGSLATPGSIDWSRVRLMQDGREVPFTIREGQSHWKANFIAPVVHPRAEDLLVFSCAVPPSTWTKLEVVPGPAAAATVRRFRVSYPNLRAVIDEATGQLIELTAYEQSLLAEPMAIDCFKLQDGKPADRQPLVPQVKLISSSATAAITELNFLLALPDGLEMGLTYRIHAFGLVEILGDERPWKGTSPWIDHRVEYSLKLSGEKRTLPDLLNRAPDYGFPDYDNAVKFTASVHRAAKATALELGEETVNGRQWNRRLFVLPGDDPQRADRLAELAMEGLVVLPEPVCIALPKQPVAVIHPPEAKATADLLIQALNRAGMKAHAATEAKASQMSIKLLLLDDKSTPAITGDGFAVRPPQLEGLRIAALTPFGLLQAVQRIAKDLDNHDNRVEFPLIASNPAVDLRAGGFGGAPHEVDFPYGDEQQWHAVLHRLIDSGMNVMTDLGMWSNWKMPVTYKYLPELLAKNTKGYDEVSGAPLDEIESHRRNGQKLLDYLHQRGVKAWLWLPIGAVPSTYSQRFPEAMSPTDKRAPCYTNPKYQEYLDAFLKELLETYPIDGIVIIRDDNGGICRCLKCQAYVAQSATRDAAWQQYLILHKRLRAMGFKGEVAVYPYFDSYRPELDPLLPEDLIVVGHGSGAGVLVRQYDRLGPMGDTWLDNIHCSFRPPTAARMKRLLADRGSFWIGGAYEAQELPWEALGYFGWNPAATVNSFRYQWGIREFGERNALKFVELSDAYEKLWDIYNIQLLPRNWVQLSADEQKRVAEEGRRLLVIFQQRIAALRGAAEPSKDWFSHLELYSVYFDYLLRRMEIFSQMLALVREHRKSIADNQPLAEENRQKLIEMHREICRLAANYNEKMTTVPSKMLAATRNARLSQVFQEMTPSFPLADQSLDIKQFAGHMKLTADRLTAGKPFELRIELQNAGVHAWQPERGRRVYLRFDGDAARLALPRVWNFSGEGMVFGDRRSVELHGDVPSKPGKATVNVTLVSPLRGGAPLATQSIKLQWE
jgi:hypothetical protein